MKVVGALPNKQILFVPDCNLGRYVQRFHPEKDIMVWPGYCPTHDSIGPEDIKAVWLDVLRHRLILTYRAETEGVTAETLGQRILSAVAVP